MTRRIDREPPCGRHIGPCGWRSPYPRTRAARRPAFHRPPARKTPNPQRSAPGADRLGEILVAGSQVAGQQKAPPGPDAGGCSQRQAGRPELVLPRRQSRSLGSATCGGSSVQCVTIRRTNLLSVPRSRASRRDRARRRHSAERSCSRQRNAVGRPATCGRSRPASRPAERPATRTLAADLRGPQVDSQRSGAGPPDSPRQRNRPPSRLRSRARRKDSDSSPQSTTIGPAIRSPRRRTTQRCRSLSEPG